MESFKGISVWCIILAIVTIMVIQHIFSDNVIEGATDNNKTKVGDGVVEAEFLVGTPVVVPIVGSSVKDKKKVVPDDIDSAKKPDSPVNPVTGGGGGGGGDGGGGGGGDGGGGDEESKETNAILSRIEGLFKKHFTNQQKMNTVPSNPASVPASTDKTCPNGYSPSADGINCSLIARSGSIEGETTTSTTPNIIIGDQGIPMDDDTEATPTPSPDKFFAILEEISESVGTNSELIKKLSQATDGSKSVLPKGSVGQKVADEVLNIKDCPSSQGSGIISGGCVFLNHPANIPVKEMNCPKVYEKVVDSDNKTKYYRCKLDDNNMCVKDMSKDGLCKV